MRQQIVLEVKLQAEQAKVQQNEQAAALLNQLAQEGKLRQNPKGEWELIPESALSNFKEIQPSPKKPQKEQK